MKLRMRTSPSSREQGYQSIRNISHVVRQRAPDTAFGSWFASAPPVHCRPVSHLADRGVSTVSTSPYAKGYGGHVGSKRPLLI